MAIIKCKMCGGDIAFESGKAYGTCEYCGSLVTFPVSADAQNVNLFNRANHFRMQNEFDKAIAAYERILEKNDYDAEAHWGIVLSRYGIEYVEDPTTHERIPTCHRLQNTSILSDSDYKAALNCAADSETSNIYRSEAERIAEIQKSILAISSQEQPYDIFICYKETDEEGRRTRDSALAQEIYYQLGNEGYKVFFSRITLEDKLGQQYEPYIFAALNSAKVMLVVGTKPEHFQAVWVRNEWSRYLALSKTDKNKVIIPCYRDMDPYELPDELSLFQAQDMSKIGFIQDLVRGIKKVLPKEEMQKAEKEEEKSNSLLYQLEQLQRLFEQGVIDAPVYNSQRAVLLNALQPETVSTTTILEEEPVEDVSDDLNFLLQRDKPKAWGEGKMAFVVDGKPVAEVDDRISVTVPLGFHSLWFQRAALKSNALQVDAKHGHCYHILVKVAAFKLVAEITETEVAPQPKKLKTVTARRTSAPVHNDADGHAIELINKSMNDELNKCQSEITKVEQEISGIKAEFAQKKKSLQKKTQAEFDNTMARLQNQLNGLKARYDSIKARFLLIRDNPSERKKWVEAFLGREEQYREAQKMMERKEYAKARDAFKRLDGLYDSEIKANECDAAFKEENYQLAASLQKQRKWTEAERLYDDLRDYKDSASRADQCKKKSGGKDTAAESSKSTTTDVFKQKPVGSSDAMQASQMVDAAKAPKEKKKRGCLGTLIRVFFYAFLVVLVMGIIATISNQNDLKKRNAERSTQTMQSPDNTGVSPTVEKQAGREVVPQTESASGYAAEELTKFYLNLNSDQTITLKSLDVHDKECYIPSHYRVDGQQYTVAYIDDACFFGRTSLKVLSLPEGVVTIANNAFNSCAVKTFYFPKSLKDISGIFEYLNGSVTINYAGSEEDWRKVKGTDACPDNVELVYNMPVVEVTDATDYSSSSLTLEKSRAEELGGAAANAVNGFLNGLMGDD